MTKDELEKATGQELIDARNYCGVDGYYSDYLENVNAEMLKRFNRIADLEKENEKLLESVEGATAMYIDLQEARKRIAELKAGRPKWHKVADGDLPKEEGSYLLYLYDEDTKSTFYEIFGVARRCVDRDDMYLESMIWTMNDVIAWCEIPRFEEVEE